MARTRRTLIRTRLEREIGVVRKERGGRLRVCLVYPNRYRTGMSSLGFQTVYHLFNLHPRAVCERAFVPEAAESRGTPEADIVSYESQTPLRDFDVIAFSVSYELDYVNLVRALRLAGVPPFAEDRGPRHPLVLAGGAAVTINPRPLSGLADMLVIGEGEDVIGELVDALLAGERGEALAAAAEVRGVYAPAAREAPDPRARRYIRDLDAWPTQSRLLTRDTEFGDLFLVEVSRGCGRGCRFCVTPTCYRPVRWRSAGVVLDSARAGLAYREAIGLVGAAVSDHPEIDEIARGVVDMGARLSVSSLRADSASPALIEALGKGGARSITIAPEAGSERLRRNIGKPIPEEQIVDVLARAQAAGIREAKLYFMVGLPGETEDDVQEIAALVRRCLRRSRLARVTAAAGAFVPKPGTPFAREQMLPARELSRRLRWLRDELRREKRVRVTVESGNWARVEWMLSRGDRRLGRAIADAEQGGGNLAAWRKALREVDWG